MEKRTEEIKVKSTIDGSKEPSLLFSPRAEKSPLIVFLHSWSRDRHNGIEEVIRLADAAGFKAVFPEFRGPNLASNPRAEQACASEAAMQDIIDVAEKLVGENRADPENIFLAGGSGGAHMALMAAGYRPELWKAVIASCPITDLAAWHGENKNYAPHIEACCGGPPSPENEEYRKRSPLYSAENISRARVYILHGKNDPSVPFTHSLGIFNKICGINPSAEVCLEIFWGAHELKLNRVMEIIGEVSEGGAGLAGISG